MKVNPQHAVLAIDPGGTTGVGAGYITPQATLKETLLGIERRKSIEVTGTWKQQAQQLVEIMTGFIFTANVEGLLPIEQCHIVIEDFVLRRRQEGGATGNLTSIWVAAGAAALMPEEMYPITWQQPSAAKTFATNDRLKMWGLWEVGSEHRRDAMRHLALKVNSIV